MLEDKDVVATIAVNDLKAAHAFYQDKLGLRPLDSRETGVRIYASGKSRLLVYESPYAGTNRATAATWIVGDEVRSLARALKAKGVVFEHYDFPNTRRDGDVHVTGGVEVAWFKDPAGNILSIVSG